MLTNIAIVAAILALGLIIHFARLAGTISGEEARRLVASGARLVDVRTKGEFSSGHLPGAVNIPVQTLSSGLKALGDPGKPIVVYCLSGARSGRAKSVLESRGFGAVHNLGPMSRW